MRLFVNQYPTIRSWFATAMLFLATTTGGYFMLQHRAHASETVATSDACSTSLAADNLDKCAKLSLQLEEKRLNQSYQLLRRYIDEQDKNALDDVQLAWLNYVDKTCHFNVRHLQHTDDYERMFNNCVQHHTHSRRVELDEAYHYIMYRY